MSKKNKVEESVEVAAVIEAPIAETAPAEAPVSKKAFQLPYKVTCSKCGSVKAVRHEVLLKRLVGFKGTLEERFNAHIAVYKCQICKRDDKNAAIEAELAAKATIAPAAE